MLVLTRRENESLVLTINAVDGEGVPDPTSITIALLDIKGSQARIGISAPQQVEVVRSELQLTE